MNPEIGDISTGRTRWMIWNRWICPWQSCGNCLKPYNTLLYTYLINNWSGSVTVFQQELFKQIGHFSLALPARLWHNICTLSIIASEIQSGRRSPISWVTDLPHHRAYCSVHGGSIKHARTRTCRGYHSMEEEKKQFSFQPRAVMLIESFQVSNRQIQESYYSPRNGGNMPLSDVL